LSSRDVDVDAVVALIGAVVADLRTRMPSLTAAHHRVGAGAGHRARVPLRRLRLGRRDHRGAARHLS
jgi:hypothetical protein